MEINIRIDYPRPLTIVVLIGIVVAFVLSVGSVEAPIQADVQRGGDVFYRNGQEMPRGGPDRTPEASLQRLRIEQEVLARKTTILRQQLIVLNESRGGLRTQEMQDAHERLLALFHDERALESEFRKSLRELQDSRSHAEVMTQNEAVAFQEFPVFLWPIEPRYGVSAGFDDEGYRQQFGFEHQAIDIPIEQGSIIYAAMDGVVREVKDRGLGFNTLTIVHNGGLATLYGHVKDFLVMEGQRVRAGHPIAISGGMPGTPGAGMLSTGPHLHFEVIAGGEPVDPLGFLPHRWFGPTWVRVNPTGNPVRPGSSA